MRYSFSFVDQFRKCPFKWYLKYGLKIEEEEELTPNHPFLIGQLLHDTIEKGIDKAVELYYNRYPIINNQHVEEVLKIKHFVPYLDKIVPSGKHEFQLKTDDFIGYIDLLEENSDNTYNIWDFKYSNNQDSYKNSMQLHIYKYYFEKIIGKQVDKLYYLFVPKVNIRRKQDESTFDFRNRLKTELNKVKPEVIEIKYSPKKVQEYLELIEEIETSTKLKKNVGPQCLYCNYENYCIKGGIK